MVKALFLRPHSNQLKTYFILFFKLAKIILNVIQMPLCPIKAEIK
jgi:hypothetical protein